jgi:hypothetical protein
MNQKMRYKKYAKIQIDSDYTIYEMINDLEDNMKMIVCNEDNTVIYLEHSFPGLDNVTFKTFVDGEIELTLEFVNML